MLSWCYGAIESQIDKYSGVCFYLGNRRVIDRVIETIGNTDIWNDVTSCVTRLVTLIVCILGVVILERAMLYQNVGSNGREQ